MRRRLRLLGTAVGLAVAVQANAARANGRFPTAQHVVVGPGAASSTLVLRTTFGVVASDDGGRSFRYVCEDALGYGGTGYDPAIGLDASGHVLVALYDGVVRLSTDRCDAPRVASLEGQFVTDLDTHGSVVAACTATGFTSDSNYVYRSEDGGATFTRLGTGVLGVQFQTLEMAKADDKRLFATALQLSPRRLLVYRSDDGGATLIDQTTFPFRDDPSAVGAFVCAVDPTNPDTVYVRTLLSGPPVDGGASQPTVLSRSDDRGLTWTELVRTKGPMRGFAISDDGKTLFVGGPDPADGLQRSTDRGATWTRIADVRVQCLRWHDGQLYVCAANEVDHFALGHSCDGGDSLRPLLGLSGIEGTFACPASTPEGSTCNDRFTVVQASFPTGDRPIDPDPTCGKSPLDGGVDASLEADVGSDVAVDAGADVGPRADATIERDASGGVPEPAGTDGCSCRTFIGRRREGPVSILFFLLLIGSALLRRVRPSPTDPHLRTGRGLPSSPSITRRENFA